MISSKLDSIVVLILSVIIGGCGGGGSSSSGGPAPTPVQDVPLTVSEAGLGSAISTADAVDTPATLLGHWSRNVTNGDAECSEILTISTANTYSISAEDSLVRGRFLYEILSNSRRPRWILYNVVHNGRAGCFGNTDPDIENRALFLELSSDPDRLFVYGQPSGGILNAVYDRGLPQAEDPTESDEPTQSNLAMLNAMREESGVTREFALAQFVAHFGPLDGAPDLPQDSSMPLFASHALDELLLFKDELSDEMLEQIYRRLLGVDEADGSTTAGAPNQNSRRTDPALTARVNSIVPRLETLMGVSLPSSVEIIRVSSSRDVRVDGQPNVFAVSPGGRREIVLDLGVTLSDVGLISLNSCWIVVNEGASSKPFDSFPEKTKEMAIAHELIHCFQFDLASAKLPGWVAEGSASWAGEAFVGGTGYYDEVNLWEPYDDPLYNLFNSNQYSAIGFWSHVDNSLNGNLFNLVPSIYSSGISDDSDMLTSVINQIGEDGYASWPTGGAGRPEWGPEWESIGVGNRTIRKLPAPVSGTVNASFGESKLFSLQRVGSAAESMILEVETDGVGLMHWSESGGSIEFGRSEPDQYCWSGECLCDGNPIPGFETLVDAPETEDLVVAMTANTDRTPSSFTSRFINVSELCPESPTPPIPTSERDSCLVGRWALDIQDLQNQIEANLMALDPQGDVDIGVITGQVTIDYQANGTATGFADVTIRSEDTEEDFLLEVNVTGNGDYEWDTDSGRYFVTYTDDLVLTVTTVATLGGTVIPIDQSTELFTREELFGVSGGAGSEYNCSSTVLQIFGEGEGSVDPRYRKAP